MPKWPVPAPARFGGRNFIACGSSLRLLSGEDGPEAAGPAVLLLSFLYHLSMYLFVRIPQLYDISYRKGRAGQKRQALRSYCCPFYRL